MNDHLLWLRTQPGIRGSARLMMFALCDHADEHGEWDWPGSDGGQSGMSEWAKQAGICRRTATAIVQLLLDAQVVALVGRRSRGRSAYRVIMRPEAVTIDPAANPKVIIEARDGWAPQMSSRCSPEQPLPTAHMSNGCAPEQQLPVAHMSNRCAPEQQLPVAHMSNGCAPPPDPLNKDSQQDSPPYSPPPPGGPTPPGDPHSPFRETPPPESPDWYIGLLPTRKIGISRMTTTFAGLCEMLDTYEQVGEFLRRWDEHREKFRGRDHKAKFTDAMAIASEVVKDLPPHDPNRPPREIPVWEPRPLDTSKQRTWRMYAERGYRDGDPEALAWLETHPFPEGNPK